MADGLDNPDPHAKHYKCGRSNDGTASQGPNEWLAKKFEAMHDMYQGAQHKNTFQVRGYQKGEFQPLWKTSPDHQLPV